MRWRSCKECPKCDGEGWLWADELDEHPFPESGLIYDDTKYECDHESHNETT